MNWTRRWPKWQQHERKCRNAEWQSCSGCVRFKTIYLIQNVFVIRGPGLADAQSIPMHSPRSVKRNFHLSLLYCHLDGRQEIVLLVFCFHSSAWHPRVHALGGQSVYVFVVSGTHDASINFRVNMEYKLHIICIQWTIVVANSQWIKWQSHRIRQAQNSLSVEAARIAKQFSALAMVQWAYTAEHRQLRFDSTRLGPNNNIFNFEFARQIVLNGMKRLSKHKPVIGICSFFKCVVDRSMRPHSTQFQWFFNFPYANVAAGQFAAI